MGVILPPGVILILGAALVPAFPAGRLRGLWMLAVAGFALVQVMALPQGFIWPFEAFGQRLLLLRADALSQAFGFVLAIAILAATVQASTLRSGWQQAALLAGAGGVLTAVYAGDLVTLGAGWTVAALVPLGLLRNRWMGLLPASAALLWAGIALLQRAGESLRFEWLGTDHSGGIMILGACAIFGAFPLLHGWLMKLLTDAGPADGLFLGVFPGLLALYALVRGFAGVEGLVWIGLAGTLYALAWLFVEHDLRRIAARVWLLQAGMATAAIGIGTGAALSGATLHAFALLFGFALLWSALGIVQPQTGAARLNDTGGLFRALPVTAVLGIAGAATLSALPPFTGYASSQLLFAAVPGWLEALLRFALLGVFLAAGLRMSWMLWFGSARHAARPRGDEPAPAIAAMTMLAALCVLFGLFPGRLADLLPWQAELNIWQPAVLARHIGLLALAFGVFWLVLKTERLPQPLEGKTR